MITVHIYPILNLMPKNIIPKQKCPRCTKNSIVFDVITSEKFCNKCGYVITENQESELGVTSSESSTKIGSQNTSDLGSIFDPVNKDSSGKPLSKSTKNSIERLRTRNSQSQTKSLAQDNLKKTKNEMNKLKDKLALSGVVIDEALLMYQKIIDRNLSKGYSIKGCVGACIFASCRMTGTPRTMKKISYEIGITEKEINRSYNIICKELELKIPLIDPIKYVAKIASNLEISVKTQREAIKMIKLVEKTGYLEGKDPIGIVSGALWVAGFKTGESITQKIIADEAGVTEGTLIKNSKYFEEITEWK